jgi:hypothetical protein
MREWFPKYLKDRFNREYIYTDKQEVFRAVVKKHNVEGE